MFTPQKIAAISGIVGSLAALCVGAGHAYADGHLGDCESTAQGGTVCIRKSETRIDKGREHILRQEQQCSTADRPNVVFKDEQLLTDASVGGSVVDCSNTAKLPEGVKPRFDF
ncbi:hypothetical protein I2W78_13520 [Streptomyces spinoverrucosus]|uniref:hypothetical protein n=1 Tax=Streptomyces spinoverrucosus TaxID=284043 RepID=UPI0018C419E1|nr:hypothetical protein [Streptomyces spinoverrucosus]MBG0852832.1 hypothetical protein [Streptomyces spinoverrucosus]